MRASTSRASAFALALVLASLSSASPAPASLRVAFDASTGDVDAHATPRLAALSRAFDTNPAFEVVSRSSPPSDASTPTADIVWETVPGAIPSALRSGQRANHFPGIGALASKSALAHLASSPGRAPVTLTQHSTEDEIARAFRDARDVPDAWLVKRSNHGGVRTLRPDDADRSAAADVELQTRPRVDGPRRNAPLAPRSPAETSSKDAFPTSSASTVARSISACTSSSADATHVGARPIRPLRPRLPGRLSGRHLRRRRPPPPLS